MSPLPLTSIPGLARPGLPVEFIPAIRDHYGGKSGGVVFQAGNVAALVTFLEDYRPLPIPLEELTVDPRAKGVAAAMLDLLRERWGKPGLVAAVVGSRWELFGARHLTLSHLRAESEAELLLAALATPLEQK